jgi:hypothetical protein
MKKLMANLVLAAVAGLAVAVLAALVFDTMGCSANFTNNVAAVLGFFGWAAVAGR